MRFMRLFLFLTYLVAALGFASLALPGDVGPVLVGLMAYSLLGSHGKLRRLSPSEPLWRMLTVLFLLYALAQYFLFNANGLFIAREMLVFLQINRLYVRKSNRDFGHIFLLAYLQILLGCLLTVSPIFAGILVAFLLATALAIMLLQLKSGMDDAIDLAEERRWVPELPQDSRAGAQLRYGKAEGLLRGRFVLFSTVICLGLLLLTLGLFLTIPRMEIGFIRRQIENPLLMSGFADEVTLGDVGRILTSQARVMRVKLEGHPADLPGTPYWRGLALDHFDGRRWRLSRTFRRVVRTRPPLLSQPDLAAGANVLQRYSLEALDSGVLFAMPEVRAMDSNLSSVVQNYTDSYLSEEKQERIEYAVHSYVRNPSPERLRGIRARLQAPIAELFTQLPPLSPEVLALARDLTADATNDYDRVAALQAHLSTRYAYTLDAESQGESPLEDFLFRTRAGHCEYFASALVILVRSLGIPARIVNGFMGGEFNPVGDYYIVRQKDAHSWVEVWFAEEGWIRFDPTPAGAAGGVQRGDDGLAERLRQALDYLEMQWYYFVLDYDLRAQIELASGLLEGLGSDLGGGDWRRPERRRLDRRALLQGILVLLVLTGLVSGALWWWRRRRELRVLPPAFLTPTGRRFLRLHRRFGEELEARGFQRLTGETPLERAMRAGSAFPRPELLVQLEETYYAARFGGIPLGEQDVRFAREVLAILRRAPAPPVPRRPAARESAAS